MIEVIQGSALFCLGLYAGSLLTEGAVLVPIWRRLPGEEFFRMHADIGPRLFQYFAPITIAGVAAPVIYAGVTLAAGRQSPALVLAAAGLCIAALLTYPLYFRSANQRFADRSISKEALGSELARWALVHWARTILVVTAFGCLAFIHRT